MALIALDEVSCAYGGRVVLDRVSLRFDEGCLVGVVGPSGSGKTTLLRLLAGALRPVAGCVHRADGLRIGYVPQVETINWSFPVTVGECVLMGRTAARRLPWRSRAEQVDVERVLERLGLGGLARRHIRELSGGQQQRMFLARALLQRPDLLLMDEPTSGVDVRTRHEVLHLLAELNAEGIAMVLTTHDLNGIAAHLPWLVCLNRRVLGEGEPRQVITPTVLEATFGARLEVLEHAGMPIVFDHGHANVVPLRRPAS